MYYESYMSLQTFPNIAASKNTLNSQKFKNELMNSKNNNSARPDAIRCRTSFKVAVLKYFIRFNIAAFFIRKGVYVQLF